MTLMAEPPTIQRCPTSLIPVEEMSPHDWFACSTWSGHEVELAQYLAKCRVHFFLPMERRKRRKVNGQGREFWVETETPRFKKYLFLNGADARDAAMLHSRRSTTATCTIVPVWDQAGTHDDLVQLDRAIKANPYLKTAAGLHVGDRVRICAGPMRGICGTIERIDDRLIVWLNCAILGRSVPVENVPIEHIELDTGPAFA